MCFCFIILVSSTMPGNISQAIKSAGLLGSLGAILGLGFPKTHDLLFPVLPSQFSTPPRDLCCFAHQFKANPWSQSQPNWLHDWHLIIIAASKRSAKVPDDIMAQCGHGGEVHPRSSSYMTVSTVPFIPEVFGSEFSPPSFVAVKLSFRPSQKLELLWIRTKPV